MGRLSSSRGSGVAIGELTLLPAHYLNLVAMQGREYLRTGVAQAYAVKYAATVAASPQLALRGALVGIPNVGTLSNSLVISPNGGATRLYHDGGTGVPWLSTDSGASYASAGGSVGAVAGPYGIACNASAFVAVNGQNGGDGVIYTAPAAGTPWTARVTDTSNGNVWRSATFVATNGSAWVALTGHNGGSSRVAYRSNASPEGTWIVGVGQAYGGFAVGLVGIPGGNIVYANSASATPIATTTDGATWTARSLPANGTWALTSLCYTGARCIAVGTATGSNKPMAHSTDGGVTWSLTTGLPTEMLASHSDCGIASDGAGTVILWESVAGVAEFRFWRSTDHGVTWVEFSPISSQAGGISFSGYRMKWAQGVGFFIGAHSTGAAITLTPAQIAAAAPDAVGVRIASAQIANVLNYYMRVL